MAQGTKTEAAPKDKKHGEHGGNRSRAAKDAGKSKKSSQAAGKDPHRGERQQTSPKGTALVSVIQRWGTSGRCSPARILRCLILTTLGK
ncbi:hypothetical protein C6558_13000 [Ensifer sp. NM-2]|jgi:hypothetical protein|nr:hypothetical protein C6558_13000 [Ensifer sp. NM-2]